MMTKRTTRTKRVAISIVRANIFEHLRLLAHNISILIVFLEKGLKINYSCVRACLKWAIYRSYLSLRFLSVVIDGFDSSLGPSSFGLNILGQVFSVV